MRKLIPSTKKNNQPDITVDDLDELTKQVYSIIKAYTHDSPHARARYHGRKAAEFLIVTAMIPQGLFGFLYIMNYLRALNVPDEISLPVALLIFYSATQGKVKIVNYYNSKNFEKYAVIIDKIFKGKELDDAEKLTFKSALEYIPTFFPSVTFSYLSWLALSESDSMLKNLKFNYFKTLGSIFNKVGDAFVHPVTIGFFAICAFVVNFGGFRNIHRGAYFFLSGAYQHLREHPEFRAQRLFIENRIKHDRKLIAGNLKLHANNPKFLEEKAINLLNEITGKNLTYFDDKNIIEMLAKFEEVELGKVTIHDFLNESLNMSASDLVVNILRHNIRKNNNKLIGIPNESWSEYLLTHCFGMVGAATGIFGLLNFVEMGRRTASYIFVASLHGVFGGLVMTSMSAMALISIYELAFNFVEALFERNPSVNLTSVKGMFWILFVANVVCILGGTPNAFQAMNAGMSVGDQIAAILASYLIEVFGYEKIDIEAKMQSLTHIPHVDLTKLSKLNNFSVQKKQDIIAAKERKVAYQVDKLYGYAIALLKEMQHDQDGNQLTVIIGALKELNPTSAFSTSKAANIDLGKLPPDNPKEKSEIGDIVRVVQYGAGRIYAHAKMTLFGRAGDKQKGTLNINSSDTSNNEHEHLLSDKRNYGAGSNGLIS